MRGDLLETTLPAICRSLASDGATGRLLLDRADGSGVVTLRGGAISDARSPQPRARLADRLTGGGHLDELTLARVLHELRADASETAARPGPVSEVVLARALLEQGLVDPMPVEEIMVGQVVDALVELGARRSGPYRFLSDEEGERGAASPSGGAVLLDVEVALAQLRRRVELLAGLHPTALRPDTVPHRLFETTVPGDQLDADAVTVLAAIDDDRNLRELAELLGYGSYDLATVLADLYGQGLVALTHPQDDVGAALDLALRPDEAESYPDGEAASQHHRAQPIARQDRDPDDAAARPAKVADWVFEDPEHTWPADSRAAGDPTPAQPQPDVGPGEDGPGEADPGDADPGEDGPDEADPGDADPGEADPDEADPEEDGQAAETSDHIDHGDTDVAEFLRELSALALGDTAPAKGRSGPPPRDGSSSRHDRVGDTGASATATSEPDEASDPATPQEPAPRPAARSATDEAPPGRDGGRKRRKGRFGRG